MIRFHKGYELSLIGKQIDVFRIEDGLHIALKECIRDALPNASQKEFQPVTVNESKNPKDTTSPSVEQYTPVNSPMRDSNESKIEKEVSVDIRVWSKERDLGSRRAGVRRFNSCSTHLFTDGYWYHSGLHLWF